MNELNALLIPLQDFFRSGGDVLWLIFAVTVLLWGLIIERFWFLSRRYPTERRSTIGEWEARSDKRSWYAHRIREALISELEVQLHRYVSVVKTLVTILPMLGLLGTITGMIQVFDVLAVVGTSNPRAMANGVSTALITTIAGLVAALSGFYFGVYFERRANAETRLLADKLAVAGETIHA